MDLVEETECMFLLIRCNKPSLPLPLQGGGAGPGGGRPASPAALLSLPGPLPAELRPERRPPRPQAPRRLAVRRLRLLAARQRDLAAAAEGPQHGEGRATANRSRV